MTLREEMHVLVQGIVGSHEARRAGLASLGSEVVTRRHAARVRVGELARARQATGHAQREKLAAQRVGLSRAEGRRKAEVRSWLRPVAADRAAAHKEWREMGARRDGTQAGVGAVPPAAGEGQSPAKPKAKERSAQRRGVASRKGR